MLPWTPGSDARTTRSRLSGTRSSTRMPRRSRAHPKRGMPIRSLRNLNHWFHRPAPRTTSPRRRRPRLRAVLRFFRETCFNESMEMNAKHKSNGNCSNMVCLDTQTTSRRRNGGGKSSTSTRSASGASPRSTRSWRSKRPLRARGEGFTAARPASWRRWSTRMGPRRS